jgi:septum formation topological specificity factor MinE
MIAKETQPDVPEHTSLEDIRNEQRQNRIKEQEDRLNIVLNYTRKSFALDLSDEHLEVLCRNLQVYINELDVKELNSVKELITPHGAIDGKMQTQQVKIYNLDTILSIGCRINSQNATQFRW